MAELYEGQAGHEPAEEFILEDKNLRVSTVWTSWSFCDRCGNVGKQRKMGLCMVKKHDKNSPIQPIDFPMIDLYPDGIPCHSTALPKFIRKIPDIRNRPSETMIRDCIKECPTSPGPINVTDKAGKVIEVLEPGFYSLHHPPTLPPITQRKVVYEDAGKHLVLSCPKRLNKVITVWKRGKNIINPLTIRKITRNRVFLDPASRLHIRKLLLSDTSVYLCFLKQEHVASFKVIVYEPLNQQLKDYISLFGMFLTCICVIVICICLVVKKSKKTHK
ncbi:Ig-like V-type domain-containing protein FAM187A [Patella vulgata]|uniref:Ig-like V-type domain-containing protein FAM187A n=1 Tax=Patella vulgata TaxID=6465 RepID=UPI00218022EC|nr:Ig-like V-type domain-containing protein FAM187A [Patella vulgata]